ncbi:NAD-dependent protein deacylase [Lapidilactobacillus wuchangensis]|uniref:NAD-dependent protein deacylase n=1 Tax=Lapidilactobacillus wuchangensis TaxID=2486001 RepID=UPI000F7B6CC4|nr:NAD-dependent protein deacylase [Lapidilactobacillus wuchangensis]
MATVADLATAIKQAQNLVFLTGAGVSTHSGIPDYRSKTGLYADQADPEYLLSHENLEAHPADFYDFVMQRMYYPQANPNEIHQEIARLCNQKGQLITQNVDGLDIKAGNQHVIEFHGDLYDLYCQKCGQSVSYQEYAQDYHHQLDQGIIRPRIVLYNEPINTAKLTASVATVNQADLIMIVGTSFRVYPFAQLLQYRGAAVPVFVINQEQIAAPDSVQMIQGDALKIFQELTEALQSC